MSVIVIGKVYAATIGGLEAPNMQAAKVSKVTALGGSDKAVLLALADNASDSGLCYPWVATIAAKSEIDERTVRRALARLEHVDLIKIRKRRRLNGSQRGSMYKINLEALDRLRRPKTLAEDNDEAALLAMFDESDGSEETAGQDRVTNSPPVDEPVDYESDAGGLLVRWSPDYESPLEPSVEPSGELPPSPRPDEPSGDEFERDTDGALPPASGGSPRALCADHGKTQCRLCNHNTRGASKVDAARERHEQREISMKCPWCPRSPDDNIRTQGAYPIAPATICDHVTPNSVILAQIAEREATEFGERPSAHVPSGAPSRSSRSEEARAEIAAILSSKRSSPTGMRTRVAVEHSSRDEETRSRVRAETAEREAARIAALGLWPDEPSADESAEEVSERTSPAEQR